VRSVQRKVERFEEDSFLLRRMPTDRQTVIGDKSMPVGTFTAVLHKEGDIYVAECPEVGTVSQGRSVDEAVANLREATELYLEEFPVTDHGRPLVTVFEARFA
jgi:predicted RNase H-like HicB family nuclease